MHRLSFLLLLSWLTLRLVIPAAFADDSEDILQPDEAFQFEAQLKDPDVVELTWEIADGYYLYRHKFHFVSLTPGIEIGVPVFPAGEAKQDQFFGAVEIYRNELAVQLPIRRLATGPNELKLEVTYQGCLEGGVCYLPIRKTVTFDLTDTAISGSNSAGSPDRPPPFVAEHDRIAATLNDGSIGWVVLSFFGFGLMLAFTPCVFPMIPIISGIIASHGPGLTALKAFALSLCYVLASALTYTVFGVMAGLFGSNLQVFFQDPKVIVAFGGIFFLLGLSMFGIFTIQLPAVIQTRIVALSAKQTGGNWLGAAIMGMLSALAIGPCVTAPLAGALIYIGKSGDAVLGGVALFALGFGMGIPLLIIGTSAGKWLPKAGRWLEVTKAVFGLGLWAVAVWLLERILPPSVTIWLWVMLLLVPFIYLGWKKLWKIAGGVALLYGVFLLAGVFTRPQRDFIGLLCEAIVACDEQPSLPFQRIKSINEFQQVLADAKAKGRWVMLDFYASWCTACREMDRYTFSDARVKSALSGWKLVQADVTKSDSLDKSLLKRFGLIGPPAVLFFGPDQKERKPYRIVGYLDSDDFLERMNKLIQ